MKTRKERELSTVYLFNRRRNSQHIFNVRYVAISSFNMGEINKTKRNVAKIKEIHSLENKTMIKVIEFTHN